MIDIADLIKAWGIVKSGSLEMVLNDEGEVLSLGLDTNQIAIDIKDDGKLKEYVPLLLMLKEMRQKMQGPASAEQGKAPGGAANKAQKGKLDEMLEMLGMLKGVANELAAAGKTVKIKYKGEDVILIGKGAKSLSLGLLGYHNMQIKRRALALKLGLIFKDAMSG
jgi:hypothetical protein